LGWDILKQPIPEQIIDGLTFAVERKGYSCSIAVYYSYEGEREINKVKEIYRIPFIRDSVILSRFIEEIEKQVHL